MPERVPTVDLDSVDRRRSGRVVRCGAGATIEPLRLLRSEVRRTVGDLPCHDRRHSTTVLLGFVVLVVGGDICSTRSTPRSGWARRATSGGVLFPVITNSGSRGDHRLVGRAGRRQRVPGDRYRPPGAEGSSGVRVATAVRRLPGRGATAGPAHRDRARPYGAHRRASGKRSSMSDPTLPPPVVPDPDPGPAPIVPDPDLPEPVVPADPPAPEVPDPPEPTSPNAVSV